MTDEPATIHVVDDDESFRSAIGELLSLCGYNVRLYETAKKLLETPLSGTPACILLDLQMADLNGLQLQDELSASGCRLPIVFVSAYGDIPTTVQTIKAGAEDFLAKVACDSARSCPLRSDTGAGQSDFRPSGALCPAYAARKRGFWPVGAREAS